MAAARISLRRAWDEVPGLRSNVRRSLKKPGARHLHWSGLEPSGHVRQGRRLQRGNAPERKARHIGGASRRQRVDPGIHHSSAADKRAEQNHATGDAVGPDIGEISATQSSILIADVRRGPIGPLRTSHPLSSWPTFTPPHWPGIAPALTDEAEDKNAG